VPTNAPVLLKIKNENVGGRSAGGGSPTVGNPWFGWLQTIRFGIGSKQVHPRLVRSVGLKCPVDARATRAGFVDVSGVAGAVGTATAATPETGVGRVGLTLWPQPVTPISPSTARVKEMRARDDGLCMNLPPGMGGVLPLPAIAQARGKPCSRTDRPTASHGCSSRTFSAPSSTGARVRRSPPHLARSC
jgi:hypothetical protein